MFELCNMKYKAFHGITDGDTTRAGLFALLAAKGADFSGFDFWSDLTVAFLDGYLNRSLKNVLLMDDIARGITYDFDIKTYKLNDHFDSQELIYYLMGKLTETEALYKVMSQQSLNIVSFNDIDQNVYGARSTTRNYDKVTVDVTNGQKQLTDVFGAQSNSMQYGAVSMSDVFGQQQDTLVYGARETTNVIASRTNTLGGGTDTSTKAVKGFNSSEWSDAEKNSNVIAQRSNTNGGGTDTSTLATYTDTDTKSSHTDSHTEQQRTDSESVGTHTDTHTDAQSTDKTETAARIDTEGIATYTDTLTHTRHIVLSPDKFFEIQKEMADYNLYKSVLDAVRESVTKGVW